LTCSDDFSSGTTEVLAVADEFLWLHPYEAVFMRVKNENDVDEGFDTKFTAALDKHPRVYTGKDDNPTLGTIRGKIVILQNFSSGTDFGVQWNDLSIQVEYSMTDQWQMARKWRAVKGQLDAATNGGKDVRYVKGTNIMTMNEIYARPWRARYGIVYADFPGSGLIHAVYNSNNFHGVFKGKESGRCVHAPSPADGTQVRFSDCTGDASQTWLAASDDQFKLLNTTKCLDVRYAGQTDDTAVQNYECNGTLAQKWFVT
jgi:hypothetical protein